MTPAERCDAAYQGVPGAYSEQAAWALVGAHARLLPCPSLTAMFEAVREGRATRAVLPIENTLAGVVPRAYELLLEGGLVACGETRVRIDHVLVGRAGASAVRRVLSHPVALDQCRKYFAAHPHIEAVPVFDTAGAVAMALEADTADTAAIASRRAAARHDATILAEHIQDHEENWTRFLLLAPPRAEADGDVRHAIVAFTLPHEPGALARVLQRVADRRVNVTKIESRPMEGRPFEYAFLLEMQLAESVDGSPEALRHTTRGRLSEIMSDLRSVAENLRLLGAY